MKPILFNAKMVQAILSGDKIQTRRVKKSDNQPFQIGDILYVRETWGIKEVSYKKDYYATFVYRADFSYSKVPVSKDFFYKYINIIKENNTNWKPSIHMPRECARIFLKVKNIRTEKLQDIVEDDVKYEGFNSINKFINSWDMTIDKKFINKYSWNSNPEVWVIEFEKTNKEE